MEMKRHRLLATFLAAVMTVSLVQVTAFATEEETGEPPLSTNQIVSGGETGESAATPLYYNATSEDPLANGDNGYDVSVQKTVIGTDTENQFNIHLVVTTAQQLSELNFAPDAAVVIVLDTSKSMQWDVNGGGYNYRLAGGNYTEDDQSSNYGQTVENADSSGSDHYDKDSGNSTYAINPETGVNTTRILQAVSAINDFIYTPADGNTPASGFAVVTTPVANHPKRMVSLVTFNSTANSVQDWVDVSTAGTNTTDNATHLAAFKTAVSDQYDITESNGTYTTNVLQSGTNLAAGLNQATTLLSSSDVSGIQNKYVIVLTDGEPNAPSNARVAAQSSADAIKAADVGLYVIGYGTDVAAGGQESPSAFLENRIATQPAAGDTTSYYFGVTDNTEGLPKAFEDIRETLKTKADPWKVTDPMGQYIICGELPADNNNEVTKAADGTLTWDLTDSSPTSEVTNGDVTTYTYEYTYPITLDVTAAGFMAGQAYATNGDTVLDYHLLTYTNDTATGVQEAQADFTSPTVKGMAGELTFTKKVIVYIGSKKQEINLPGAKFTLSCGDWSQSATSSNKFNDFGKVTFSNVPSGNTYTLTETQFLSYMGYSLAPVYASYQVKVSQGNAVLIDPQDPSETIDTVYNSPTTSYTVTKSWDDGGYDAVKFPDSVRVTLSTDPADVSLPADSLTQTLNSGNGWSYTWSGLPMYDANGSVIQYSAQEEIPGEYTAYNADYAFGDLVIRTRTAVDDCQGSKTINLTKFSRDSLVGNFIAAKLSSPVDGKKFVIWTPSLLSQTGTMQEKLAEAAKQLGMDFQNISKENTAFIYGGGILTGNLSFGGAEISLSIKNAKATVAFDEGTVWQKFVYGTYEMANHPGTAITNTYTPNGKLTIQKIVSGVNSLPEGYSVTVSYGSGAGQSVTLSNFTAANDGSGNYVATTDVSLAPGEYTISETSNGAISGYSGPVTAYGTDANSTEDGYQVEVQGLQTTDATVTNTYQAIQNVQFYIQRNGEIMDTTNHITGRDSGVFSSKVSSLTAAGLTDNVAGDSTTDPSDANNAVLTALSGRTLTGCIPTDQQVFNAISTDSEAKKPTTALGGVPIDYDNLTTDNYTVQWYVLKEQSDAWHVDGVIVPKATGTLTLKKDVAGKYSEDDFTNAGEFKFDILNDQENKVTTVSLPVKQQDGTLSWSTDVSLIPGSYTVREQDNLSLAAGYSVTTTYSTKNAAFNIEAGQTTSETVKNKYTYSPDTMHVVANKVWDDDSNRDGIRPDSVRFALFDKTTKKQIGAAKDVFTPVEDQPNTYTVTFSYDSRVHVDGVNVKEVGYTIGEMFTKITKKVTQVPGYSDPVAQGGYDEADGQYEFTITNTHEPETLPAIPVVKTWSGSVGSSIELALYADGSPTGLTLTMDADNALDTNTWAGTFAPEQAEDENSNPPVLYMTQAEDENINATKLYVNQAGKVGVPVVYSVEETKLNGDGVTGNTYGNWTITTGAMTDAQIQAILATIESETPSPLAGFLLDFPSIPVLTVTNSYSSGGGGNNGGDDNGGGGNNGGGDNGGGTTIVETPTPTGETPTGITAEVPTTTEIPEKVTPLAATPATTGDSGLVWVLVAAASGTGLFWMFISQKKRKDEHAE